MYWSTSDNSCIEKILGASFFQAENKFEINIKKISR